MSEKFTLPPGHPDRLLNEQEAADFLGVSIRTMQNWRHRGGGPSYIKLNSRSVRYQLSDLKAWIEAQKAESTSDASERLGIR